MAVATWQPGNLYQPSALVVPLTAPPVVTGELENGNFEDGDMGWDKGTGWVIATDPVNFDGPIVGRMGDTSGVSDLLTNDTEVAVTPGLSITATCAMNLTGSSSLAALGASLKILWYDSGHAFLSEVDSGAFSTTHSTWQLRTITGTAPSSAAFAKFAVSGYKNSGPNFILVDAASWNYVAAGVPEGLIFRAVQADAAYSANTEPVWPTVLGNTVVDGGVTWEAVQTTRVVWEASPILVSGDTEPTFPTTIGGVVADNTIGWKAISRRIEDPKCPNTTPVAIAVSKVFAGDKDIVAFCATIKPLDWSTRDDAGYLPFGLQTYGAQPVGAIGLWNSNLAVFNAQGMQLWQVDEDPANMALLDAKPIPCTYPRTIQPSGNDLNLLNSSGVRNVGTAKNSTNLEAGAVGEPIDALVKVEIKAGTYDPFALTWPAANQYWLIFGPVAFVLTTNGANKKSWSRYEFPAAITDWTLNGNDLILRAGNLIWRMDPDVAMDDTQDPMSAFTVGPPPVEAISFVSEEGEGYINIPPVDNVASYTVTGWARYRSSSGLLIPFADSRASGLDLIYIEINDGDFGFTDPNTSGPSAEAPAQDTWFFFAIRNSVSDGEATWCYLADVAIDADHTVSATGFGTPVSVAPTITTVGAFYDTAPAFQFEGDICQVRRWKAELTDEELLAEKDSSTVVRTANIWSSNPFFGAADMSDESGNGRTGTPHGTIADVADGPGN